ncbi:MAG: protoglobin domain-containing protein [Isosphaeraceae bacterium]
MNPDPDRIYRRYVDFQTRVGWTDEDAERIRAIRPLLLPHLPSLVKDFSAEVGRQPEARQMFVGDQPQVERLEQALLNWLTDLITGPYDRDYVARRWRVGAQLVEVGLDQVYTNIGVSRLRDGLVRDLGASWTGDRDGLVSAIRSLNKLLDLDLAKIEDAYQSEYVARIKGNERLAMLGQIAGGIAHEIRNPLNVIKTSHYFLRSARNPAPEKRDEHMQRIERNVRQAEHVISTLTSFARMPAADQKPFSLRAGIKEAIEDTTVPAGIEVVVDCPDDLPLALADPAQIRIALGNLVRNACDAMPAGGRLTIGGRALDDAAEIAVIDTGVGITAAQLERITEPLFSTKARGLGLGLALVRIILDRNGASMSVASEPGQGSTFAIRLALAPPGRMTP